MSVDGESARRTPDWEKVHEVAIALLGLCESHRRRQNERKPQIPSFLLEAFEEAGWIDDARAVLGWVELSEAGQARSREMLEKHFGIVVGKEPQDDADQPA